MSAETHLGGGTTTIPVPSGLNPRRDAAYAARPELLPGFCYSNIVVIAPTYDQTAAAVRSGPGGTCEIALSTDGIASESFGLDTETTVWVDEVSSAGDPKLSSLPAVSEAAGASGLCGTFDESSTIGADIVFPPSSVYDWLSDPLGSAITTIIDRTLPSGIPAQVPSFPANTSGVYISRAFSGGGQWIPTLYPQLGDDSCLVSQVQNGPIYYNEARVVNVLLFALDAAGPLVSLDDEFSENNRCVVETLSASVTALSEVLVPKTAASNDPETSLVSELEEVTPNLLASLVGCAYQEATVDLLTNLLNTITKGSEDVAARAQLPAQLGAAVLKFINLVEYSHAVESAFIIHGNPFSTSSTTTTTSVVPSSASHIDGRIGFKSVSCSTPNFCAAVDASGGALTWNGSVWSSRSNIDPNGSLDSVSCTSDSFCMAIDNASGAAFIWNGQRWSATASSGSSDNVLTVSCSDPNFCVAAGGGRVATWQGNWSSFDQVDSTGGPWNMGFVSCANGSFCMALDGDGNAYAWMALRGRPSSRRQMTPTEVHTRFLVQPAASV